MTSDLYIYKKEIDWSVLHYGINIPVSLQNVFYENIDFAMKKGDSKKVRFLIDGQEYPAIMTNIYFDENKYPSHKDLLQIRYTQNSLVAKKMQHVFFRSYEYLRVEKNKLDNKRKQLSVPLEKREYLAIYSTSFNDVFLVDCITCDEIKLASQFVNNFSEYEIEQMLNSKDLTSGFAEKDKTVKIRKLDRAIGTQLKQIYSNRCQICGLLVGEKYDSTIIHTHHIEPFSTSLNNNPSNLMVICPNHHGVIHDVNPIFDRKHLMFIYNNGYTEALAMNFHL